MEKGHNTVYIACLLELLNAIKKFAGETNQNEGFWLAQRGLECIPELKEEIIKKHGKERYEEIVNHYRKTNIEQRKERELKAEEKRIREEAKAEIEQLRTEAYAEQTNLAVRKRKRKDLQPKIADLQDKRKNLKESIPFLANQLNGYKNMPSRNPNQEENMKQVEQQLNDAKKRLAEIEKELKELEA